MTKKDYIKLAEALKMARKLATKDLDLPGDEWSRTLRLLEGIDLAQDCIIAILEADNPRFDRNRFRATSSDIKKEGPNENPTASTRT